MVKVIEPKYFVEHIPGSTGLKLRFVEPILCNCDTYHYSARVTDETDKVYTINCLTCKSDIYLNRITNDFPVIDYRLLYPKRRKV